MNELELIRSQLGLEMRHFQAVSRVCAGVFVGQSAAAPVVFAQACGEYLLFAVQRLSPAMDEAAGRLLTNGLTAARGADTSAARTSWQQFLQLFDAQLERRAAQFAAVPANSASIGAWRQSAAIDADSILLERQYYQRVKQATPEALQAELP